jgi:hypothetical protein
VPPNTTATRSVKSKQFFTSISLISLAGQHYDKKRSKTRSKW